MNEIIYILINRHIPDLIKIGRTSNLDERVRSLSAHSGVPVPFEVHYACTVANADEVEKRLHDGFGDHRINPKREFFKISPERVLSILKLVEIDDVTPNTDIVADSDEQNVLDKERSRKSNFSFRAVGIEPGSVLKFVRNEEETATVIDDRKVNFEGQPKSLTRASLMLLNRDRETDLKAIRGPDYWVYEGETLTERRQRLEEEGE